MSERLFKVLTTASRETGLNKLYVLAKHYGEAEEKALARMPSRARVWDIKELRPLIGESSE